MERSCRHRIRRGRNGFSPAHPYRATAWAAKKNPGGGSRGLSGERSALGGHPIVYSMIQQEPRFRSRILSSLARDRDAATGSISDGSLFFKFPTRGLTSQQII